MTVVSIEINYSWQDELTIVVGKMFLSKPVQLVYKSMYR